MKLGCKIRLIRESKSLKQEYVADQLGITQQALSHIERSEDCSVQKLQAIARVLQVNIQDFLTPPILIHKYF